ncbi:exodeoxyribonuclease III [Chromatiales bacterium (ex Bugula neritina AB1)]|nr:exodeoxyribonuclease III [Chromatiales bacterium (ex Bugula neritina AB1)]
MRIITLNCNGIRSAARKGFYTWMQQQNADVVCLQETKAQQHQLEDEIFNPSGYTRFLHDAEKPGYSGTALYCRQAPKRVVYGIGDADIDREGRYLEAVYENLSVVSLYMPSGSSGDVRQAFKIRMMDIILPHLLKLKKRRRQYVLCGDWNIAHKECDIRNWRGNKKNSGFLPEEREWLTELFDKHRYVDTFRCLEQEEHEYTWWSNRGQAWANNTGWRIDYQISTPGLGKCVKSTSVYREERFSDHAPLTIDYDFEIA